MDSAYRLVWARNVNILRQLPHSRISIFWVGSFAKPHLLAMRKRLPKFAGSCLRIEGSTASHSHGRQTLLLRPPCNLYQSPLETDLFFFKFRLRILENLTCHVPEFAVVGTEFRLFGEAADLCRTYQAVGGV